MRIPSLFGRHTVSFSTPDRNLQVVTHKLVPSVYSLNGYRPHNPYSPMVVLFPFSTENRKNGPYQLNIQNFLPWRGPLVTLLNSYDVTETAKFYRDCGRLHDTYLIITEKKKKKKKKKKPTTPTTTPPPQTPHKQNKKTPPPHIFFKNFSLPGPD